VAPDLREIDRKVDTRTQDDDPQHVQLRHEADHRDKAGEHRTAGDKRWSASGQQRRPGHVATEPGADRGDGGLAQARGDRGGERADQRDQRDVADQVDRRAARDRLEIVPVAAEESMAAKSSARR